jgi:hypothetical protein
VFTRYLVTLRHDGGTVCLETVARDANAARSIICGAESAPLSAVLSVREA